MNENALDSYISLMHRISVAAQNIAEWAENHGEIEPGAVNWGHVGSAEKIAADLREICRFANIEQEEE